MRIAGHGGSLRKRNSAAARNGRRGRPRPAQGARRVDQDLGIADGDDVAPQAAGIGDCRHAPRRGWRRAGLPADLAGRRPGNARGSAPTVPAGERVFRSSGTLAARAAAGTISQPVACPRPSADDVFRTHESSDESRGRAVVDSSGVPCWAMRPPFRMTMRSAITMASSRSWVTWMAVMPSRFCSARISWRSCAGCGRRDWRAARRAAGSPGSIASARPSATRWRWPPDSSVGLRSPSPESRAAPHLGDPRGDLGARLPRSLSP